MPPTPGKKAPAAGGRSASSKSTKRGDDSAQAQPQDEPKTPSQRAPALSREPSMADNPNVKVLLRIRPFSPAEVQSGSSACLNCDADGRTVHVNGAPSFGFDAVFPTDTTQERVYTVAAEPIVNAVLQGYNGTIFSYGQTGTGKTYTMVGEMDDEWLRGIVPRVAESLFVGIAEAAGDAEFTIRCSYLEIYLEKVRDLLDPSGARENLPIHESKEHGIWVGGAAAQYVASPDEMLDLLAIGNAQRTVAATRANAESSRSHAVFIVTVKRQSPVDGRATTGKLCLVDLAGSEKIRDSDVEGQQLEELKINNKSLSALGIVINVLAEGKSAHVPYRDSKLTRLLQEALGGNARTALILTASPAAAYHNETLSALRFGQRAKRMRNSPRVNLEMGVAELKALLAAARRDNAALRAENAALRSKLEAATGEVLPPPAPPACPSPTPPSDDADGDERRAAGLPPWAHSSFSEPPVGPAAAAAAEPPGHEDTEGDAGLLSAFAPPPVPPCPAPPCPSPRVPAQASPRGPAQASPRGAPLCDPAESPRGAPPRRGVPSLSNVVRPISSVEALVKVRLSSYTSLCRTESTCACGRKITPPARPSVAPHPPATPPQEGEEPAPSPRPPHPPRPASLGAELLPPPAPAPDPAPAAEPSLPHRRLSLPSPPRSPGVGPQPSPVRKPLLGGAAVPPLRFALGGGNDPAPADGWECGEEACLMGSPRSPPLRARRAFLPQPTVTPRGPAPRGELRAVLEQERRLAALLDELVARLDSAGLRRLQATMRGSSITAIVERSNAILAAVMAESRDVGDRLRAEVQRAEAAPDEPVASPGRPPPVLLHDRLVDVAARLVFECADARRTVNVCSEEIVRQTADKLAAWEAGRGGGAAAAAQPSLGPRPHAA